MNITKSGETKLNLSRSQIIKGEEKYIDKILKSHMSKLLDSNLEYLLSLEASNRIYQITRLNVLNKLNPQDMFEIFPKESWPILFFEKNKIKAITYTNLPNIIYTTPAPMREEIASFIDSHYSQNIPYKGILSKWESEECLALYRVDPISPNVKSIIIRDIRNCYNFLLGSLYHLSYIRFLKPPWSSNPPLLQTVYEKFEISDHNINELLTKLIDTPLLLGKSELIVFGRELNKYINRPFYDFPNIISFPNPFNQFYAYGENWLNFNNESVRQFLRILAKCILRERQGKLSTLEIKQFKDGLAVIMQTMLSQLHHNKEDREAWAQGLQNFGEFVKTLGFANSNETQRLIPSFQEFVPGSFGYLDVNFNFAKPTSSYGEVL